MTILSAEWLAAQFDAAERAGVLRGEWNVLDLCRRGGERGLSPLRTLVAAGAEPDLFKVVAWVARGDAVTNVDARSIPDEALRALPLDLCRRVEVVGVSIADDGVLVVACSRPPGLDVRDEVRHAATRPVRFALAADPAHIELGIRRHEALVRQERDLAQLEAMDEATEVAVQEDRLVGGDGEVDSLLVRLFTQVVERGASDVHFEPRPGEIVARARIGGVVEEVWRYPSGLSSRLVSRIKAWGGLDVAQHNTPDEGRATRQLNGRDYDLRILSLPTVWGYEKIAVRILASEAQALGLDELGFSAEPLAAYRRICASPWGLVIVSGPTGAGKTTTLYATMDLVATPDRETLTVEDPVELRVPGMTQMQINPRVGLDFASALRSVVRADLDVLLIGEIRDPETAKVAVDASLTGHLVFSTVHTPSAALIPRRLLELGVPAYSLASAIQGAVNQRLVRALCPSCKEPGPGLDLEGLSLRGAFEEKVAHARTGGCARCFYSGYAGRLAIAEVMEPSARLAEAVATNVPADQLERLAREDGMLTLAEDAAHKLGGQETSIAEIRRILGPVGTEAALSALAVQSELDPVPNVGVARHRRVS